MSHLTPADIATLERQDRQTLIDWEEQLNTLKWPDALAPEIILPISQDGTQQRIDQADCRRYALREWINDRIGHRELLRYHNIVRLKSMNEEEFEDFWKAYHEGDEEAAARNYERDMKRAAEAREARNGKPLKIRVLPWGMVAGL